MFKIKNFKLKKYLLTTIFVVTSLFANNLLFSFNQREEYVLTQLQNNYVGKIQSLEQELTQYDIQQMQSVAEEPQEKLNEIIKEISKETSSEKLEILEQGKASLELEVNNVATTLQLALTKYKVLSDIKQQLQLIKTGISILNTEKSNNNQKILSINSIQDLELFNTVISDHSLFKNIDYTMSSLGKIQLILELDINRKSKEKLERTTTQINEILDNEKLFNKLGINLQNTTNYVENYLASIRELKNTQKEQQINKFMHDSESKLSYYLKPALLSGITSTTINFAGKLGFHLINKTFTSSIATTRSLLFRNGRLNLIKNLFNSLTSTNLKSVFKLLIPSELIKKTFTLETYKSWQLFAVISSYFAANKLTSKLASMITNVDFKKTCSMGMGMGLNILITKLFGIPYIVANMATVPFYGIKGTYDSIKTQYETKREFKKGILQKFYNLNTLFSQLRKTVSILESNENLKPFAENIKELVTYNQNDELGNFLALIRSIESYEQYKDKEVIQALYKTYISIFIKMENPEYKKLITNALKDFGKIDVLFSKVQLCKHQGYTTPEYMEKEGKPYMYFKNAINPIIREDTTINTQMPLNQELLKMLGIEIPNSAQEPKLESETEDEIMELNEYNFQGFNNQDLNETFKIFVYNLILSHIGIVKAEQAIITPVDNILTMLNTSSTENLAKMVNRIYSQNKSETSMVFINNTELQQITKEEDYSKYITYSNLQNSLNTELLPAMLNSYYFFTV